MVHVPLAFVVFAVAGYLSVWAVRVRHQLDKGHLERAAKVGTAPNADVHHVVRSAPHPVSAKDQTRQDTQHPS